MLPSSRAGSGTGEAMIDFAFTHFGPPVRSWGGPIAARNLAPLRFCEHIGYRLGRVSYLYHRWLD